MTPRSIIKYQQKMKQRVLTKIIFSSKRTIKKQHEKKINEAKSKHQHDRLTANHTINYIKY